MDSTQPPESPRSFSLSGALFVLVACGVVVALFVWNRIHSGREDDVVAALRSSGAIVEFVEKAGRLRIELSGPNASDDSLLYLSRMKRLQSLTLRGEKVTDSSLEKLGPLQDLPDLHSLGIFGSSVTESGFAHLKGLPIRSLLIGNNEISPSGLEKIAQLENLTNLTLYYTGLTDNDLVHLKPLTQLDTLHLQSTKLTDAGIAELQKALPDCEIMATGLESP